MGADMFIEDKKERDAFQRQVDLTALQYGMGELSKERAQARADRRDFNDYIVNKPGTYFGREYKKNESIRLNMEQVLSLGPKAMQNLSTLEAFTERRDAILAAVESLKFPEGALKIADFDDKFKEYDDALSAAKKSETAIVGLNDALIMLGDEDDPVTGWRPAGKELWRRFTTIFQDEIGGDVEASHTLPRFKRKLGIALNAIIPSLIGDTQSANSISDRDVGFIITAFLDEGLIKRDGDSYRITEGLWNFASTSEQAIADGLQAALGVIQQNNKEI